MKIASWKYLTLIIPPTSAQNNPKDQNLQDSPKQSNFCSSKPSPGNQVVIPDIYEVGEKDAPSAEKHSALIYLACMFWFVL